MLKSDLIERLSKQFTEQSVQAIAEYTSLLLNAMVTTISKGRRIEIRGFGSFESNYYAPRKAHNPKTGERITAAGKYRPHFKAGKELRSRVNQSAARKSIS